MVVVMATRKEEGECVRAEWDRERGKRRMGVEASVGTRFLTLTGHAVLVLSVLQGREENVAAGQRLGASAEELEAADEELVASLSLTLAGIGLELLGLFSGLSTFDKSLSLFSIVAHFSACIAGAFFVWDIWPAQYMWLLFVTTSALPAIGEIAVAVSVFACKKPPV